MGHQKLSTPSQLCAREANHGLRVERAAIGVGLRTARSVVNKRARGAGEPRPQRIPYKRFLGPTKGVVVRQPGATPTSLRPLV